MNLLNYGKNINDEVCAWNTGVMYPKCCNSYQAIQFSDGTVNLFVLNSPVVFMYVCYQ